MPGIMPDQMAGGVVVRNGAGAPTNPPNVVYAFVPPPAFVMTCPQTALPSDCTARVTPGQVNALQSEILALAATMNPTGTWNCNSATNLATMFSDWADANGLGCRPSFMCLDEAP
jgi:hypothetical protein